MKAIQLTIFCTAVLTSSITVLAQPENTVQGPQVGQATAKLIAASEKLATLVAEDELEEAAAMIAAVQNDLSKLMQQIDSSQHKSLQSAYERLLRVHGLLELEGFQLEAVPSWDSLTAAVERTERVSFARQVAPLLLQHCQGCHIGNQRPAGNLRMDSFAQFKSTGDNGPVFTRGAAADSLLIRKLKGQAGQRMPAGGRAPLSEEEINTISTWIREGARFDAADENARLKDVADTAWVAAASHQEIFERRKQLALERWQRVLPNDVPAMVSDDSFIVMGNVASDQLELVLEQLQDAVPLVRRQLRQEDEDVQLINGGLVVYVLKSRYDYSEFGLMTEQRELPKNWFGHWQASPADVYAVLASGSEVTESLSKSLALQLVAGSYLGSFAGVPHWLAEGVARNLVVRVYRRDDPRIREWQVALPIALQKVDKSEKLADEELDEESAGLVGLSVTNLMMNRTNLRRFDKLLELLRSGQAFEDAMLDTYGPTKVFLKAYLGR
ncbi:MAG: hypothetical protein KDB22_04515 [Planctomycetales bacterium]|nr:hypothetical protein [Planctomycetales bacterium]